MIFWRSSFALRTVVLNLPASELALTAVMMLLTILTRSWTTGSVASATLTWSTVETAG
jgi:hypothetical protein